MKIYPPPEGLTTEQIKKGWWTIYADVKCTRCGKEYSLPNCLHTDEGLVCKICGGRCE